MITRGATTIWENWEGTAPDGSVTTSLNHYSKGAVVSFPHRYVAGISPREDAPGYRHFDVRPRPGGGLSAAEAEFDSVRGRVAVRWRIDGGRFDLDLTVPPTASATVVLPDGTAGEVAPGDHHFTCAVN